MSPGYKRHRRTNAYILSTASLEVPRRYYDILGHLPSVRYYKCQGRRGGKFTWDTRFWQASHSRFITRLRRQTALALHERQHNYCAPTLQKLKGKCNDLNLHYTAYAAQDQIATQTAVPRAEKALWLQRQTNSTATKKKRLEAHNKNVFFFCLARIFRLTSTKTPPALNNLEGCFKRAILLLSFL